MRLLPQHHSALPLGLLLLLLLTAAAPAARAFIPSPTPQPTTARIGALTMSSVPMPSANAPLPDRGQAGRKSIFPPPLMSFYGEQRKR